MANTRAYFITRIYEGGGAEYGIYSESNPTSYHIAKNYILDYADGINFQDAHNRLVMKINTKVNPFIPTHTYKITVHD
jgi:hypothetical protein